MKPLTDPERLELNSTLHFIYTAHLFQARKGTNIPFVLHPIAVCNTVNRWGINDNTILKASLAHDVLEDCPDVSEEDLKGIIGIDSLQIVKELTFIPDSSSPLSPSKQKEEYIKQVGNKSIGALVIKIADRLNNVQDFMLEDSAYAYKYFKKAKPLFDSFFVKREDIENSYGEQVYINMIDDLYRVGGMTQTDEEKIG